MVGMSMSFSNPQFQTPHGGPPFHGWKKGFGFGKALGPGGYMNDPGMVKTHRATPTEDRCFASSPYWRNKYEIGKATGFGIGDRSSYGAQLGMEFVSPNSYGDVSKKVSHARRNFVRPGMTMKQYFPTAETTYREKNVATAGPGPAKYNTSTKIGQSSLVCPAKSPSYSMGGKPFVDPEIMMRLGLPSPAEYSTRTEAGKNAIDRRGVLREVSCKWKFPIKEMGAVSPGPARYFIRGDLDKYTLKEQVANTKVPKAQIPGRSPKTRRRAGGSSSSPALLSQEPDASADGTVLPPISGGAEEASDVAEMVDKDPEVHPGVDSGQCC